MKEAKKSSIEHPALKPLPASFRETMKVISGKWKVVVLWHLCTGAKRYNELHRLMPKVTQHMLTKQLRELEQDGIIKREVFPEVPPRVEYSISKHGATLEPLFDCMEEWGEAHLSRRRGKR